MQKASVITLTDTCLLFLRLFLGSLVLFGTETLVVGKGGLASEANLALSVPA